MRDPDLVFRAQLAAASLESAWHRWRVVHGLTADPMPTVSSYVGYSLEEPWGQPRVVFGLAAEDAEQLAGLLERHDCVGPVYAAVAALPGAKDMPSRSGRVAPLPVPRQAPPSAADEPDETAEISAVGRGGRDDGFEQVERPGVAGGYDEPVFRQAAAAIRDAAALKGKAAGNGQASDPSATAPTGPAAEAAPESPTAEPTRRQATTDEPDRRPGATDYFDGPGDSEPMGALAQAATAARAAAEARIRAALTEYRSRAADGHPYPGYDDEADASEAGPEPGPQPSPGPAVPDLTSDPSPSARPVAQEIYPTDVLEPLPRPEVASGAFSPSGDEPEPEADQHLDADFAAEDQPPGSTVSLTRRNRLSRAYPIPRLSRSKRPGAVPAPDGQG